MQSWTITSADFVFDPRSGRTSELRLATRPPIDQTEFVVDDLSAVAADGVLVPMSLVRGTQAFAPQIVVLEAYGAYGSSSLPEFDAESIVFIRHGAALATCHVRGGGELGEAW